MLCWLSKLIAARRLDDGKELSPSVRAHFNQCPACREAYEQERRLIGQLSATASVTRREAPPFLRARILANLDRPSPDGTVRQRVAGAWAVAAVIVLTGTVLLTFHFGQRPTPSGTVLS